MSNRYNPKLYAEIPKGLEIPDLTGLELGLLRIVGFAGVTHAVGRMMNQTPYGRYYRCRCGNCGNEVLVELRYLSGERQRKSCGAKPCQVAWHRVKFPDFQQKPKPKSKPRKPKSPKSEGLKGEARILQDYIDGKKTPPVGITMDDLLWQEHYRQKRMARLRRFSQ